MQLAALWQDPWSFWCLSLKSSREATDLGCSRKDELMWSCVPADGCPLGVSEGKGFHVYWPSSSHASVSPFLWNMISPSRLFWGFTDKMLMHVREALTEFCCWLSFLLCIWTVEKNLPAALPWYFFTASHVPDSSTAFPWGTTVSCFFPVRPRRKEELWFNSRAKCSKPHKHVEIKCLPPPGFPSNLQSLSMLFLEHNCVWKEPIWVLYSTGYIFKSFLLPIIPFFEVFLSLIYGFGDHL